MFPFLPNLRLSSYFMTEIILKSYKICQKVTVGILLFAVTIETKPPRDWASDRSVYVKNMFKNKYSPKISTWLRHSIAGLQFKLVFLSSKITKTSRLFSIWYFKSKFECWFIVWRIFELETTKEPLHIVKCWVFFV